MEAGGDVSEIITLEFRLFKTEGAFWGFCSVFHILKGGKPARSHASDQKRITRHSMELRGLSALPPVRGLGELCL